MKISGNMTARRVRLRALVPAASALFLTGMAVVTAPALASQRVSVEKNHTLRVSLAGAAASVIVGNPDIADVNIVDSHTLYIIGKGTGSSAVTVTDAAGRPLYDGEIVVTSSQRGAITVYHGLKPSHVVCSDVCVSTDDTDTVQAVAPASGNNP